MAFTHARAVEIRSATLPPPASMYTRHSLIVDGECIREQITPFSTDDVNWALLERKLLPPEQPAQPVQSALPQQRTPCQLAQACAARRATLVELSIAEQEARNCAALAAIRARSVDIGELERLSVALSARGLRVRPAVTTDPIGAAAVCTLHLWASCTPRELGEALDWLNAADVTVTRHAHRDVLGLRIYTLGIRSTTVQLNVQLTDRLPSASPATAVPEAA